MTTPTTALEEKRAAVDKTIVYPPYVQAVVAERTLADRIIADEREKSRRLRKRISDLLEANGCECECDHHHEEHDDDCERCFACAVSAAMEEP